MTIRSFPFWRIFFACSFFTVVLPLGILLWGRVTESLPEQEMTMLRLVHSRVLTDYVENRDSGLLLQDAISGMVGKLDEHSAFIPPDEVGRFEGEEIEGTFEGIGVLLARRQTPVTILCPLPGGPAERAGLAVGDRILGVDGQDISDLSAEEANRRAVELIHGPAGTPVRLRIGRDAAEDFEVEVRRSRVPEAKVKWAQLLGPERKIGYLFIESFQRGMVEEFDAAVRALTLEAGGELLGLIIDLRYNPGGLLSEAIELSNRFLTDELIVSMKRRDSEIVESHSAEPGECTLPDLPLVLILNRRSASASEVAAGALQDHGRARIVGERSYGKGVVQSIYKWEDLDFRLKMTTSHYYTPKGRNIEKSMRRAGDGEADGGLAPDREVRVDDRVFRRLRGRLLRNQTPARYRESASALAGKLGFEIDAPPDPEDDPQLAAALEEILP